MLKITSQHRLVVLSQVLVFVETMCTIVCVQAERPFQVLVLRTCSEISRWAICVIRPQDS